MRFSEGSDIYLDRNEFDKFLRSLDEYSLKLIWQDPELPTRIRVAGDLYDLWLLITKYKVKINIEMIHYKLQKYTQVQGFNIDEFLEKVISIGEIWNTEIESLLNVIVPFDTVKDTVIGYIIK